MILGAVLAGGRSRRFGADKAFAPFRGEPMVVRTARALDAVCRDVVLVGPPDGPLADLPFRVIPDRVAGAGPLAGLDAALRHARDRGDRGVLLLGCDMPLVTPGVLRRVATAGSGAGWSAAAASTGDGAGLQPLCAWYGVSCLDRVAVRLGGADRSLRGLLDEVGALRVRIPEGDGGGADPLASANTPGALARLEELLARKDPAPRAAGKGTHTGSHGSTP